MAIAGVLSSCKKDEGTSGGTDNPISLTAIIQDYQSRSVAYNTWTGMYDRNIAVRIGDEVKEYQVDKDGKITSENPFFWDGRSSVKVDVWYPYNEGAYSDEVLVFSDQSITDNFLASDQVSVLGSEISEQNNTVTVTHRVAKVVCSVTNIENIPFGAKMAIKGVGGLYDGGDEVTMTANYIALLPPQTIPAGTASLKVIMEDLSTWSSANISDEIVLEAGMTTYLNIEVSENTVNVTVGGSGSWNGEDGGNVGGNTDTVNPGTGSGSWDDSEGGNLEGGTDGVNPGSGNGSWNGEEGGNIDGNTDEVSPGDGNGSWNNGDGEDVSGDTPSVNPGDGNGSWDNGNGGDVPGETPTVNPDDGNGSWDNGDGENVPGQTPTVNPDDGNESGSWTNSSEDVTGKKEGESESNTTNNN